MPKEGAKWQGVTGHSGTVTAAGKERIHSEEVAEVQGGAEATMSHAAWMGQGETESRGPALRQAGTEEPGKGSQ